MQVRFDFVYDREKGRSKTNKVGCNAYIWSSQPTLGNRLLLFHHCIAMLRPGAEFELNWLGLDSIGKGSFGHYLNYLFPLPPIDQKCSWWKRPKKFGQPSPPFTDDGQKKTSQTWHRSHCSSSLLREEVVQCSTTRRHPWLRRAPS